jgi:uncharacterized membrane protein
MLYVTSYLIALSVFLLVDMIWLGTMTSRFYRPTLGDILLTDVNLLPAIAFYLLYPVGLVLFAIQPAMREGNIANALLMGALFGLFTYGTYDLSNHATLRNWTTPLTVVDMLWGGVLGAMTCATTYWVLQQLGFRS